VKTYDTVAEVAERMKVREGIIQRTIRASSIPAEKVGGVWHIPRYVSDEAIKKAIQSVCRKTLQDGGETRTKGNTPSLQFTKEEMHGNLSKLLQRVADQRLFRAVDVCDALGVKRSTFNSYFSNPKNGIQTTSIAGMKMLTREDAWKAGEYWISRRRGVVTQPLSTPLPTPPVNGLHIRVQKELEGLRNGEDIKRKRIISLLMDVAVFTSGQT